MAPKTARNASSASGDLRNATRSSPSFRCTPKNITRTARSRPATKAMMPMVFTSPSEVSAEERHGHRPRLFRGSTIRLATVLCAQETMTGALEEVHFIRLAESAHRRISGGYACVDACVVARVQAEHRHLNAGQFCGVRRRAVVDHRPLEAGRRAHRVRERSAAAPTESHDPVNACCRRE